MGWSWGTNTDRPAGDQEIGYGVQAVCDERGCGAKIDRGLSYACGDEHFGGIHGCGGYFCMKHLGPAFNSKDEMSPQLCKRCRELWEAQ